jgi:hypothetical protein
MTLANWQMTLRWHPNQALAQHRAAIGSFGIVVLAVIVFIGTFHTGIERGMDRLVSQEGYGRVAAAIAVVLTRERNQIYGYALSNCIYQELTDHGFSADPAISARYGFGPAQNLRSAGFLDTVLENTWRDLPNISE